MALVLSLPPGICEPWRGDGQTQSIDQSIDLVVSPKYRAHFNDFLRFIPSPSSSPSDACCEAYLASHPFRKLFAIRYGHTVCFFWNGSWSDVSLRIECTRVTSLEWDHLTDRLFVGTSEKGIIVYRFSSLDEGDLSQYSSTAIHLPLPPAALSFVSTPLVVHSLKSCPRGRFLAVLTSTFASRWSYREIALWDYYSSSAPTPLTVPGYGWKYQSSREEKGEGLCCLEWSPTGLYLAVGARDGSVVVVNSMTWRSSLCCIMPDTSISSLAWISPVDFLFSTSNRSFLHSVHISSSSPVLDASPSDQSSDEEIYPLVSSTPLSLSPHISSLLAKDRSSDGSSEDREGEGDGKVDVVIERIKVNSKGNLLTISVRPNTKSAPALPTLKLSPTQPDKFYPLDFVFRSSHNKRLCDSDVVVSWSTGSVTIEPDTEQEK